MISQTILKVCIYFETLDSLGLPYRSNAHPRAAQVISVFWSRIFTDNREGIVFHLSLSHKDFLDVFARLYDICKAILQLLQWGQRSK